MATDLERLVVSLEANITKFEREFRRAREQTDAGARAIEKRTEEMSTRIDKIMSTSAAAISSGFSKIGGLIGSALSVSALKGYADAWTEAGNKIKAAGEEGSVAAKRQSELTDIAIRSRSDLGAVVDLYTGLYRSTAELGKTQAQVATVTETISKAFTIGGQSAASAAGAIQQLNQAFGSGKLSGDEFNSVLEGAPILARLIAKEFGVTVGQLKKLAEDGKLTSDRVFGAIEKGASEVAETFSKTNSTIAQSFVNLNSAMTRYIGQTDQGTRASEGFVSVSQKVANAIQGVADNINIVGPAAAIMGAALLALSVAGPVGAGIAGLSTAFYLLGDSIQPIAGEIATLGDYAQAAFNMLTQSAGEGAASIQRQFAEAADIITGLLSSISTDGASSLDLLLSAVKAQLNAIIGTFVFAVKTITATWNGLGFALAETIANAMNAVIATIESALRAVTGAINGILSAVNSVSSVAGGSAIELFKAPDLGRIKNGYAGAGAAAGKAYGEAFDSLTKDYVGAAVDSAKGTIQGVRDAANAAAAKRADAAKARAAQMAADEKTAADLRKAASDKAKSAGGDKGGGGKGGADKVDDYEREIAAIEKRTRAFASEQEALSKSAFEVAKAEASFRLLEAAKKANVPITDELTAKVGLLSTAYANAKVSLDKAKETQQRFESESRQLGSTLSDGFKDAVLNGEKLVNVLDKLLKSLASRGIDSIFDSFFGKDGAGTNLLKGAGGGLGGLISGITGRAGGGPVKPGTAYTVGESGRETFVPTQPGRIIPAGRAGRGGPSVRMGDTIIDARGADAGVEQRLRALVAAQAAESRRTIGNQLASWKENN